MKIVNFTSKDKSKLNDFIKSCNAGSILQSWQWGEVEGACGRKVFRIGVVDANQLILVATIIKYELPFGKSYLYSPRGPVMRKSKIQSEKLKVKEGFDLFVDYIKKIGREENIVFLRMDPLIQIPSVLEKSGSSEVNENQMLNLGFVRASRQVQSQHEWSLDISSSEEEILAKMKSKTRYNIRLARRKGVKAKMSDVKCRAVAIAALARRRQMSNEGKRIGYPDIFWKLLQETAKRDSFRLHPKEHYQKIIEILGEDDLVGLFVAEYKNEVLAMILVSFFGQEACYLHGASSELYKNLMANHLLQWEAILEAKRKKCTRYNFGGIAPNNNSKHPWAGITRFKKGFGGKEITYIGAWELPFQKSWYRLYRLVHKFRQ